MGHARCEELMGFNMGLASVCEGGGGKKEDAGGADTFCGEADGNVPSWETTTRVPSELSTVCK